MVYERSLIAAKPINKLISEVFFKSGLMEAWGRGIPDIFDLCKENGLPKPEFELAYGYVYLTIRFAKPLTPPAAKPSSTTVSMSSKAAKSSPFRMPTPTTPGLALHPSIRLHLSQSHAQSESHWCRCRRHPHRLETWYLSCRAKRSIYKPHPRRNPPPHRPRLPGQRNGSH